MATTMLPHGLESSFASSGQYAGSTIQDVGQSTLSASGGASNVQLAMKLAMQFFLQPEHYRKLNRILAESWKDCHSLTAAVRLMEAHGVDIGRDPRNPEGLPQWLLDLDEARAIEALVAKMPQKSPEQFEHFFLQLSFIASTTQRLRVALDGGQPELVDEALESAENVGVLPYLLKMAVSQAGQEVLSRTAEHDQWLADTESTLSPLLTISAEGMGVQKELTQARSDMALRDSQIKAIRLGVLAALTDDNDKLLMHVVFNNFCEMVKRVKSERILKAELQKEYDEAKESLTTYQSKHMSKVKRLIQNQREQQRTMHLTEVLAALKAEERHVKEAKRIAAEGSIVAEKMQSFSAKATRNAKQSLMAFCGASDDACKGSAFGAWRIFMDEMKREKELEGEVEESRQKMQAFKEKQKSAAGCMLQTFAHHSADALLQQVLEEWKEQAKFAKLEDSATKAINKQATLYEKSVGHFKETSYKAGSSLALLEDETTLIHAFHTWKMEAKVERMRRLGRDKNEKRKRELIGVKSMFSDFANKLEGNLAKGTPRVEDLKPQRKQLAAS